MRQKALIRDQIRPQIQRVKIRNYKSIGLCNVRLPALTVLVGRNGAGKSNLLDALSFVVDSLRDSLEHAIRARGGIDAVRRRSTGHPRNFAIELELALPGYRRAVYSFELATKTQGAYAVRPEILEIYERGERIAHYRVSEGKLENASQKNMPPSSKERLYLVSAAGYPVFRPVYDALLSMGFYNLNPEAMKELQSPDASELLHRDGSNLASVIARLAEYQPPALKRIKSYLSNIVPGVSDLHRIALGPRETIEFRQAVKGAKQPWRFFASNMSDGTLRALGMLVAVMQLADRKNPVTMVGIEEPETALHPAAAGALMEALREASAHTQVLVTSHSPDLLNQLDLARDHILVVESNDGTTQIAPTDSASIEVITKHLESPGDLLRMNHLEQDRHDLQEQQQTRFLFEDK